MHQAVLERVELAVFRTTKPESWSVLQEAMRSEGLRPARLREGCAFALRYKKDCSDALPLFVAGEIVKDEDGSGATALVDFLASKKFI